MTEENAQSAAAADEASSKKGGTQFIMKMIFLALIVLAIVFYVRSLDYETSSAESAVDAPAPEAVSQTPAPAPAATQHAQPAMPSPQPAVQAPSVAPKPAVPATVSAPPAAAPVAEATVQPKFRPLTEEEVLRQIQETFAPETLAAPGAN